ncbi:biotin--[acetyl-CoA-carboxylase] ligase [Nocardiopsis ansamitocini]|uniref:biotin--[biotin carboxyl-carrier protein] ligase n=1 Tax=Nocardiopsis ansamitocini TaxID=1670832 RepID=A0A9W6P9S1_9ACTN|nr:biotin--[acetyl-CoA-carboxylase] ligase [Nocardiopsis ansamitocini]GLU49583.1 biotin--[acetyl-CoA-carboxylase] ligase [Nocardiopsis ansamitocini]
MTSFDDFSSPYSDLDRPPLNERGLVRALVRPGALWTGVEVTPATASTNTELAARARDGLAGGSVLVTEHQTAGRGRLDRAFHTPARAALTFSVLLRPDVVTNGYGWMSLLMGVAAVGALRRIAEVDAVLKWPNDVLLGDRKLAGILAEAVFAPQGNAIVVGMGLNVSQRAEELPVDTAVSLALAQAPCTDRDPLLRAVLRGFADRYTAWVGHGGDAEVSGLAAEYRACCDTVGRQVRVHLPGDVLLHGTATGIDAEGRLTVRADDGVETALSAGDVVHVRGEG